MIERLNGNVREVISLAGNIAARRRRTELGLRSDQFVRDVCIRVGDVREAYSLLIDHAGWSGSHDKRLNTRLALLPAKGEIDTDDLKRVLR